MQKKIDFTNCKKLMSKAYNGETEKKIVVEYEGEQYCGFIDDTSYLTDLQREFYRRYFAELENKLILPGME